RSNAECAPPPIGQALPRAPTLEDARLCSWRCWSAQALPEPGAQRQDVNVFARSVAQMLAIIARAALRLAHLDPMGRPIADAGETLRFHEGFHQPQRQALTCWPIAAQTPCRLSQQTTGQVRRLNPGQNQKPAVMGQMRQTALPLATRPGDKLIACGHFPGGGAKEQTSHILTVAVPHQIM